MCNVLNLLIYACAYGYKQFVHQSTHKAGHTLDLILTNSELLINVLPIDPPLLSDHSLVVAELTSPSLTSSPPVASRVVRQWRNFDADAFASDLAESDLLCRLPDTVDAAFDCYDVTLRQLIDKHAPRAIQRCRRRTSAAWFDGECREMKRATRRLEKTYRRPKSRTTANRQAWRQQFDLQRSLFQSKFVDFWRSTIDDNRNNPRALWRTVNSLMKAPAQPSTNQLTASKFAEFFQSKVKTIRDSTASLPPPSFSRSSANPLASFDPLTDSEVNKILSCCPTKSSSLDPIPTWLLKQLSHLFVPVIRQLCNLSLETGSFPSSHTRAIVFPRLKKPNLDPDSLSSYRPISNLSFISKLVERAVAKQFMSHTSTNHLLPQNQSAYRPFHSTETAVVSVHNDLVRAIDSGHVTCLILLDLSSAFDTVDHQILLSILNHHFNVTDNALTWFETYLSDRTNAFCYDGITTVDYILDCSVPQGSVLGPQQFSAYTSNIPTVFKRHAVRFHLYADDKQAYDSGRVSDVDNIRRRLSECASDVAAWCAAHRLQLNTTKTEVIWFGSHTNLSKLVTCDLSVIVNGDIISPVHTVRNLGVLLDDELNMRQHVNNVARICFYHLRRLRQIRRRAGYDVTVRLVLAVVMSRIDYCNAVLASLPAKTIEPLQRVQKAAARLVLKLGPRDHVTSALQQLHWLPVSERITYKLCLLMYAAHSGNCPAYIADIVQTQQSVFRSRRPGLRSADSVDYFKPRLSSTFGERSFSYAGPHEWNKLPTSVRSAQNINIFKRLLKTHLYHVAFG